MTAAADVDSRPCEVRRCTGRLECYDVRVQDGTGDRMFRFECSANFRHRAWLIASLGVLHKEVAGRWDTPRVAPAVDESSS